MARREKWQCDFDACDAADLHGVLDDVADIHTGPISNLILVRVAWAVGGRVLQNRVVVDSALSMALLELGDAEA